MDPTSLLDGGMPPSLPADLVMALPSSATRVTIDLNGTTLGGLVVYASGAVAVVPRGQAHLDLVLGGPGVVTGPDLGLADLAPDRGPGDLAPADTCKNPCARGEVCGPSGACVCPATGQDCLPDHTCMPTYCAPNTCEALDDDTMPGEWYTLQTDCTDACKTPATCTATASCLGRPCPNGLCWRCL
jgi:hypothetical protein